ncbi:MAG: glycosyltransferase family 4 protein [Candidatus Omnitrophica bacterium]|nr:glycosyltransferase family 4 protein [Candidatus Omnitrophota bacterium]
MKILVVTQYFWPENFRINDLTAGLVEKGHAVTVLTGIPNYPGGEFFPGYGMSKNMRQEYQGAKIIRVPLIPRGNSGKLRLVFNYFSFVFFASILAPFVCREKYDLIFVCQLSPVTVVLPAILLKKLKAVPIILWVQDLWPESLSATGAVNSPFLLKLVEKLVHFIYHKCDLILVQSKAFIPLIRKFGVKANRISYLPNNTEIFYRPVEVEKDAPERKKIPQGFIVMFAGNIGAAQDFSTIISAAEKLNNYPDIYWVILGDGRRRQWAQDEVAARNLEDQFIFLGRHPPEQMPRYFALADVLLVTLSNEEIFKLTVPAKVQSYLACAKPIIASLAGEGARIIEEAGAGFSCRPEYPESLAQLVLKVYSMLDSERCGMGRKGREYFEKNFERYKLLDQLNERIARLKGAKK